MGRTAYTEPQCMYNGALYLYLYLYSPYGPYGLYRASVYVQRCTLPLPIPLLPLWTVRPVQSLSACTTVHFTFTYTSTLPMNRTACTEPQCLYKFALYLLYLWYTVPHFFLINLWTWLLMLIPYKNEVKTSSLHHVNILAEPSALAGRELYCTTLLFFRIPLRISTCIFFMSVFVFFCVEWGLATRGGSLVRGRIPTRCLQTRFRQNGNRERHIATCIFRGLKWLLRSQRGMYKMIDNKLLLCNW